MEFVTARDTGSGAWTQRRHSRYGFIALLVAVTLLATPPAITRAADDPTPTSEEQPRDDSEKATQENEEKQGFWKRFKDPEDGKLDLTAGGEQGAGIFPIVIPFNEPAVGFGLVLAVGYFHPTKSEAPASPADSSSVRRRSSRCSCE